MNQAELHLYRNLAEMLNQNSASVSSPAQKVNILRDGGRYHSLQDRAMGWRQLANYIQLSWSCKQNNKLLATILRISLENKNVMVLKTAQLL